MSHSTKRSRDFQTIFLHFFQILISQCLPKSIIVITVMMFLGINMFLAFLRASF